MKYEFNGKDENGYAIFNDVEQPTKEQKEAERQFDEWLAEYERREKKC